MIYVYNRLFNYDTIEFRLGNEKSNRITENIYLRAGLYPSGPPYPGTVVVLFGRVTRVISVVSRTRRLRFRQKLFFLLRTLARAD